MRAIQQRGGITIVQDPSEAPFSSMPMSVMQEIKVDYSRPLRAIAPLLARLSRQTADEEGRYPVPEKVEIEARIAQQEMESDELIKAWKRLAQFPGSLARTVMERFGRYTTTTCSAFDVTSGTPFLRRA